MKRASLTVTTLLLLLSSLVFSPALRADDAAKKQPASVTPAVKNPERHEGFLKDKEAALAKGPVDVLFVGDSITDGWRKGEQFKLMTERWGKYNPLNIGISGDRTQHVLWRLDNGEVDGIKPKAVMLMIGTNNLGGKDSVPDTIAGVTAVVAKLREKLPESKILLLGIFPRRDKPDHSFDAEIKEVNEAIAKLDDAGHVKYLDISEKFLAKDGELTKEVMPDFLHPNAKGYQIWADAVQPSLEEMLK